MQHEAPLRKMRDPVYASFDNGIVTLLKRVKHPHDALALWRDTGRDLQLVDLEVLHHSVRIDPDSPLLNSV